ncbi:MAG: hypothetical protein RTU63_05830 [Candidatus Thorarchaeota archaeon]
MGLFDSWRRKRKSAESPRIIKPKPVASKEDKDSETTVESPQTDSTNLVAEYEQLTQRKEDLQVNRDELTAKLDRGEIETDVFRKELMNLIQEAAVVSEKLQTIAAELTAQGFRGFR